MNKLAKSLFAAASFALPMSVTLVQPAAAAYVDVASITGSGTLSPGLNATVQTQSISFTGTATVVGTDGVLATYPCSFSGSGSGNAAGGTGVVSGSCGPINFPACTFVFTGVHVTVACPVTTGVAAADCVFTPTNVNPTTRYNLVCGAFIVQVP